ncbi:MAG: variant-type mycofactocin precursor [Oscillochloridaceae bacterium umkhey_bin13]
MALKRRPDRNVAQGTVAEQPQVALRSPAPAVAVAASASPQQPKVEQPALLEEVLIEEVSIDGMCGVY